MKLSEIEPYLAQMVSSDKSSLNTKHQYRPDYAEKVVERDERYIIDHYLYTAEQMQEYAKAKVFEALGKYGVREDEWSDHEVELAHKQMTKFIFEEDTKND